MASAATSGTHGGRSGAERVAQVLQGAARDPQQEQVEHGQEAELQGDGDRLDDHGGHQSTSKRASTVPTLDPVARAEAVRLVGAHVAPVDAHAVGRAEVGDRPAVAPAGAARRAGARRWCRARTMSHSRLRPMMAPPGPTA